MPVLVEQYFSDLLDRLLASFRCFGLRLGSILDSFGCSLDAFGSSLDAFGLILDRFGYMLELLALSLASDLITFNLKSGKKTLRAESFD